MKAMAFNGSPRRNDRIGNTIQLLKSALEGAASEGAETELINLYDYDYHGCISCFSCKRLEHIDCKCAVKDEITDVLERAKEADVLIFGSPIYLGNITGAMQSFLERLMYPLTSYEKGKESNFTRKINHGFIFDMNGPKVYSDFSGYSYLFKNAKRALRRLNGVYEELIVYDTHQFDDYSKYQSSIFSEESKNNRLNTEFPKDLKKAYELGKRLMPK